MKRKHRIILISSGLVLCLLLILGCCFVKHIKYSGPLNRIESIKYFEPADGKYAYRKLTITPTMYCSTPWSNSVTAKAIYQNDTIGLKIVISRSKAKIHFRSIGKQSDNFVKALAALYEESSNDNAMRSEIESVFAMWGGGVLDWSKGSNSYKLSVVALDGKTAEIYLDIDIPNHRVSIGDKNAGLSKRCFVNAFRE